MTRSQRLLAATFTVAGTLHFIRPRAYEAIMPSYLPRHRELVAISGAAEVVGGLSMIPARSRGFARWWLTVLLIAIFPANLHMALNPDEVAKRGVPTDRIPPWLLWARLPLQPLMIWWAWRATAKR